MQVRRAAIALGSVLILIAGCGRRVEHPCPESGLIRAFSVSGDLRSVSCPFADVPEIEAVERQVQEELILRPVDKSLWGAPLSFAPSGDNRLFLRSEEDEFCTDFTLIRGNPEWHVAIEGKSFELARPRFPEWKLTAGGAAPLWWEGGELAAQATVPESAFYDVVLTASGRRVFESVPRVGVLVDGDSIMEVDVPVPRHGFEATLTANTYIYKGKHSLGVVFLKKHKDSARRIDMPLFVKKLELVAKDMVALPSASVPRGATLSAHYSTMDCTGQDLRLFANERGLTWTEQGLLISGEGGLDVVGEYRPAILAPPETVFEWDVWLPPQATLGVGMAIEPTSWLDVPSPVKFTVAIVPDGVRKRTHTVIERTLDPWSNPEDRKWLDVSLDLSRWAGRGATLRFSTTPAMTEHWGSPLSLWSEPRLRGRTNPKKNYNVVIHLIDTLRKDHLGCYGYDKETSPTIDAVADNGILFEDPVSQFPSTWASTASLLTGLYPTSHGCWWYKEQIHPRAETLAQALAAHGYLTFAVSDNHHVHPKWGFGRGFDRFYSLKDRHGSGLPAQTPAELVSEAVNQCLEAADRHPFFLYVHSVYPHDDYWAPVDFRERFTPNPDGEIDGTWLGTWLPFDRRDEPPTETELELILALYDAEVRYGDALTERVLDALQAAGVSDETVLVLTADHGDEFHEHGSWGHHHSLFGELLNVPLIVGGPSLPTRCRIPQTVRLIDVVPTVLDVLEIPPINCHGESLLPLIRGEDDRWRTAFSEAGRLVRNPSISIRDGRFKYIKTKADKVTRMKDGEFLFDVVSDPSEHDNLLDSVPEVVTQMKEEAARYYEQYRDWFGKQPVQSPSPLSPEEIHELKAVGYLR